MTEDVLVARSFSYINSRELEKLQDLLAENTEFYFQKTQPLIGKGRILKFFKILFREYPELSFEIQRVIVQENRAALHWTNRGINRSGKSYENEGVTILDMEGGKVKFISDLFKDTEKF